MRLVECIRCKDKSSFRFCSDKCFISYAKDLKRKFVECAVCQYDPVTGRIGNVRTHRLCADCKQGAENKAWKEPSENEQGSNDIDAVVAIAGGGVMLEALAGGKRKADTTLADNIVAIALRKQRTIKRRRKNASGQQLRGWTTKEDNMTLRDIAKEAGCSAEYVRKVLKRVLG